MLKFTNTRHRRDDLMQLHQVLSNLDSVASALTSLHERKDRKEQFTPAPHILEEIALGIAELISRWPTTFGGLHPDVRIDAIYRLYQNTQDPQWDTVSREMWFMVVDAVDWGTQVQNVVEQYATAQQVMETVLFPAYEDDMDELAKDIALSLNAKSAEALGITLLKMGGKS